VAQLWIVRRLRAMKTIAIILLFVVIRTFTDDATNYYMIRDKSASDEEAFSQFYVLLAEFKKDKAPEKPE
jgi:hypothetical protein